MGKVLVTGGAGFIGSHIVDALMAQGEKVCAFDNLSTGSLKQCNSKG
ncbi:NAD-dependent epimerase/dehydratase family protein [Candidatus Bathyarchaeota archaeon]|nr:NAD-dependent epimerase/dehydratase family protein [Candidatus Bathyarchaeota archaeon]